MGCWVIFGTIKAVESRRFCVGSGTPVLRDFAKIVTFGHTGFMRRMGPSLPSESHFRDGFGRSVHPGPGGCGISLTDGFREQSRGA